MLLRLNESFSYELVPKQLEMTEEEEDICVLIDQRMTMSCYLFDATLKNTNYFN